MPLKARVSVIVEHRVYTICGISISKQVCVQNVSCLTYLLFNLYIVGLLNTTLCCLTALMVSTFSNRTQFIWLPAYYCAGCIC